MQATRTQLKVADRTYLRQSFREPFDECSLHLWVIEMYSSTWFAGRSSEVVNLEHEPFRIKLLDTVPPSVIVKGISLLQHLRPSLFRVAASLHA